MGNTIVSDRVTISHSNNTWTFNAGDSVDKDTKAISSHIEVFKILRAADGDEKTLSEKDLKKLSENTAFLKSFGYDIEVKDGKEYVITSDKGENIIFNFETIKETFTRKFNEVKESWINKDVQRLQKRYADKYDISYDSGKYNIQLKQDVSVYDLAEDLSIDPISVAKDFKVELNFSGILDKESGLYDKNYVDMLPYLDATISNCEKGSSTSWDNFRSYIIPAGFDISVDR